MNQLTRIALVTALALAALHFAAPAGGGDAASSSPQAEAEEPAGGLRRYFLALLVKGPNWSPEETPEVLEIQRGHMANLRRLADEGKLVLAGPFEDAGELRGLFVLEAATREEAIALCAADPAIRSGRLRAEIHAWWTATDLGAVSSAARPGGE